MRLRFFLLLVLLFFRFSLGWLETSGFKTNQRVSITGNIYNIYLKDTECIISLGRFWINLRTACSFSRNTKVEVIGNISGGVIDKFLGRLWLDNAELSILDSKNELVLPVGQFSSMFGSIREKIVDIYRRSLPEPESSLVAGIILGYKNDIGRDFYELMVKSGTIHIAVASGYNIMLVGGTVLSLCFWILKRKWASIVAVLAMIIYAIEAGGEPPVIRAVIMAMVVFWAAVVGRKALSWWILLVTGWLMILFEPLLLVNVSFQLSMAASAGLMMVEPAINRWVSKSHEKMAEILGGSGVLTSVSTMLTTAPLIWWHFGRMSWIGIVSNILILPFIPALMITGALMQVLPEVFSWPTYAVAHWMVGVIRFFGS